MELIRYIHLNPLRAKLVQDLNALDKYPWSGHSAILGRCKNPLIPEVGSQKSEVGEQAPSPSGPPNQPPTSNLQPPTKTPLAEKTIEDILLHFGETRRAAIKRYREFVEKGVKQGKREDFQGGGLVRSAGGDVSGLLGRSKEEREKGDARILGSGEFVNATLKQSESDLVKKYLPRRPIADFIELVAVQKGISPELIRSNCRQRKLSEARALVAYLAVGEGRHTLTEVGRYLGMKHSSVSYAVRRGETLLGLQQVTNEDRE